MKKPPSTSDLAPLTGNVLPDNAAGFDPSELYVDQNFKVNVRTLLTHIRVGRPGNEFFRADTREAYSRILPMLEHKSGGTMEAEWYVVLPAFYAQAEEMLVSECKVKRAQLTTCYRLDGSLFIWPAAVPVEGAKREDRWAISRLTVIEEAKSQWVKAKANMVSGSYEFSVPLVPKPDPTLTERPFDEILQLAFKRNYIRDDSHTVIKELLGA